MTSKLKTDILETGSGSGTIALNNQLSGMTHVSQPTGSVLQMVENTRVHADNIASTSSTYIDSGLVTGVITPVGTGSKIELIVYGLSQCI